MNKQDFTTHKESIMSIAQERVKRPFMPVSDVVAMAEDLAVWAKNDSKELAKAGLNILLISELATRAGALRYIQSEWSSDKRSRSESTKKWQVEAPKGYELQAVLLHYFLFAFNNNSELLNRVDEIAKNDGHADMIQDLMDYATLGRDNIALLKAVGFDVQLLKQADELSDTLGELLAYNNNDKGKSSELKDQRDRAFVFLYDALSEVNRVGKFVFWRNPERKKGYVNNYN